MELKTYLEKRGISQKAFAELLGLTQPSVSNWLRRGRVPAKRVPEVSRLTGLPYARLNPEFVRRRA